MKMLLCCLAFVFLLDGTDPMPLCRHKPQCGQVAVPFVYHR
jgi:hypothetical protein